MARYVVPVVVLLALFGGYVVGQQTPDSKVTEPNRGDGRPPIITEKQLPNDVGVINELATALQVASPSNGPVGRYLPFEGGKMLDTTNGTLYAMDGNPTKWKAVATMMTEPPADLERGLIEPR